MKNIISIVAYSGVGKTTLIENIVGILSDKGYKVGTVKHDVHGFDIDKEGKDTYRHRKAGARKVCISSGGRFAFIEERDEEMNLYDILKLYEDMDLVIVEGYKEYDLPNKIEITRSDKYTKLVTNPEKLFCIVSDVEYDLDVKQFKLNQYEEIAEFIENII